MALFGRSKKEKPPKNTDSPEFRLYMCRKLDGRYIKYAFEKGDDGVDRVIGKGGVISFYNGDLSVVCGEKTVFCCTGSEVKAWEFMSLEGATISGFDKTQNKERTISAYYTYFMD
ncbi:MAG: hypothetical protein J5793_04945 [Clostridia bacterium]|nr:hypothetical protein [Clostridia bacterium]